jgi:hypothetical protein
LDTNINTTKKNEEAELDAIKKYGLEIETENVGLHALVSSSE